MTTVPVPVRFTIRNDLPESVQVTSSIGADILIRPSERHEIVLPAGSPSEIEVILKRRESGGTEALKMPLDTPFRRA